MKLPIDFANPAEKIKLTDSPAPSTSVYRLPSRYPKIIPHTSPNGNPFVNKNIILYGGGISAKSSQEIPAIPTINKIPTEREADLSSEIILIPANFETA
jgi:hypothetical protein